VKSIVANFPSESAVSVHESQSAFSHPIVACSIAYIQSNFGWLPDSIKHLETLGLPLQESTDIMKNASEKLGVMRGEVGERVSTRCRRC
jgi:Zn-dependent M32 family carboxypeptidase